MIQSVTQRPWARIDLLEQFVYFVEEESMELAERYFTAVDETCALLVKQPRIGAPYDSSIPELAGLRRKPVKGFEKLPGLLSATFGWHGYYSGDTRRP
jgi:plasmid stabilization system protein ParE